MRISTAPTGAVGSEPTKYLSRSRCHRLIRKNNLATAPCHHVIRQSLQCRRILLLCPQKNALRPVPHLDKRSLRLEDPWRSWKLRAIPHVSARRAQTVQRDPGVEIQRGGIFIQPYHHDLIARPVLLTNRHGQIFRRKNRREDAEPNPHPPHHNHPHRPHPYLPPT